MIREIMKDPIFLSQKAKPVTKPNPALIQDMLDTMSVQNYCTCVGMATNMIGVNEQVIVICDEPLPLVMYNPKSLVLASIKARAVKLACVIRESRKHYAMIVSKLHTMMNHFQSV